MALSYGVLMALSHQCFIQSFSLEMSGLSISDHLIFNQLVNNENIHDCEVSSDGASSTCSDIEPEFQDFEFDEFDASEREEDMEDQKNYIVSGRTWSCIAPINNNTIEFENYSLTEKSVNIETIDECFHLFINEQIIDTIILHTNNKAHETIPPNKKWNPVDRIEIDAILGLLLMMGRFRESYERKTDLWRQNEALCRPFYAATMSRDRFSDILKHIRFDDYITREDRKAIDKLAPLRAISNIFIKNCRDSYSASSIGTVDEQLVTFRGRCSFKVHMPNKPDRYGIKIFTLCDAKTFYCCNMDIYLGKIESIPEKQQAQRIVKQLTDFWRRSNRSITTNNSFTDIRLAEELLANDIFLTGTVRKRNPDLPKILTQTQHRQQYSADFLFTDNLTLVSYVPKPEKCVILLSSLHHEHFISNPENSYKPDIVNYYNTTKNSVEVFDKIVKECSCRRCTRRWPLSLFMHYVDVAAYNAFVIWITKNPTWESNNTIKVKRKLFLENLAKRLVADNINRRATLFENHETTLHKCNVINIE
ncbi:PREDICTED: uncharacterized protein LOC108577462 [Habropoda laboriosa]|uniref:uncharacterized protein LOC108577462 n=1 Tax=Habropoda laboriosa TaxID=597456 RepID=UPI00083D13C5|nr:PREDICTED: uncharacterized protein LOC108577462 [Habropoda laboriosa]